MTDDLQIYDPVYGRSVKNGATDTCSKCGGTIPENHVPLLLWDSENHNIMWAICEKCEGPILALAVPRR